MKHLRQTVLFILLGFLLTACHHTADRLLSIEQLIKLKPDSALSLLRQIQYPYLQPIITQYFIDNKSEIWLLFLIAHSKR